jgi:hypothetical protein
MKSKLLTLGTTRDYILNYFPNLLWWDGFNKHEVWDKNKSYKHRQGMPNEIRIEFDDEDTNKNWKNINFTAINLWNEGYSFAIFYVEGGRSPHIHIYDLDELETLSYENRTKYREKFLTKICPLNSNPDKALCDEKHLCALEFANHFKYNKPKQLFSYFWNGRNIGINFDIKYQLLHGKKQKKLGEDKQNKKLKLGETIKENVKKLIIENLKFETIFDKYKIKYRGHMALCPFHADGNNSLSFSNEKGLWKCWGDGCGAKGDIITLIKMLKEKK